MVWKSKDRGNINCNKKSVYNHHRNWLLIKYLSKTLNTGKKMGQKMVWKSKDSGNENFNGNKSAYNHHRNCSLIKYLSKTLNTGKKTGQKMVWKSKGQKDI